MLMTPSENRPKPSVAAPQQAATFDSRTGRKMHVERGDRLAPEASCALRLNQATNNYLWSWGLSVKSVQHILARHLAPGWQNKDAFPQTWTESKILDEIILIMQDPKTQWFAQLEQEGPWRMEDALSYKWVASEARDGEQIRVVYIPTGKQVITAFPETMKFPDTYQEIDPPLVRQHLIVGDPERPDPMWVHLKRDRTPAVSAESISERNRLLTPATSRADAKRRGTA